LWSQAHLCLVPNGDLVNWASGVEHQAVDVEVPPGGGEGMLVTEGGRFGGWGLYLLKGKPFFVYNLLDLARVRVEGAQALSPGKHAVVFDFKYDGPGFGKGGTGVIRVDGTEVARQQFTKTIPFALEAKRNFRHWLGYRNRC